MMRSVGLARGFSKCGFRGFMDICGTSSSVTFSFHFIGDQQKLQQLAVAENGNEEQ